MAHPTLSRLVQLDKAAQVAKPQAAPLRAEEPLSAEARALPEHIILSTEPRKLNKQTPLFRCPAWADLPSKAWHLACERDGVALPPLSLQRYPFYLLGKGPVCDYQLEHPSISAVHAALVFHKQHACFVLVDLGSTNGSRVNGARIERQKPVPVPAGAVLQFGYSTRRYTVALGPAQRRDEHETVSRSTLEGTEPPASAIAAPLKEVEAEAETRKRAPERRAAGEDEPADVRARVEAEVSTAPAPAAAPPEPERVHLYHLVIKHKDVENAVSRAERNKGEVITRSRQDAREIAQFILSSHAQRRTSGQEAGAPFDRWTVEEFIAAVEAYTELATGKKRKAPGDLGLVERGTFSDEFDAAAFALRREEVSKPVETPLGIHLIYRCD